MGLKDNLTERDRLKRFFIKERFSTEVKRLVKKEEYYLKKKKTRVNKKWSYIEKKDAFGRSYTEKIKAPDKVNLSTDSDQKDK